MKRSFLVALAAAILSAKLAGAVGYTGEEIERLEEMVEDKDLPSLRDFVQGKPDISPDDPLGALLLSLVGEVAQPQAEVDIAWNVHRVKPRRYRARQGSWGLAWHWRPSHRVIRGLYGYPGRKPPHIY